jgi:hypothetical protein
MNAQPAEAGSGGGKAAREWRWTLLAALVCLAAISRQSLWIDEALTAIKAAQPTFAGWRHAMAAEKASDLQMPFYMAYVWGWAHVFGISEWALRAANLPWMVAGWGSFIGVIGASKKCSLALVAFTSSFAWYYLDEARPYAMQLGATLIIFAALFRLKHEKSISPRMEGRWIAAFWFGVIALSGSSLLGMIWAGAACLSVGCIWSRQRLSELARAHWLSGIISCVILFALAGYYLWTMKLGARASEVGQTDARNLGFIAYELLGFSGLGPGRLEIRDEGLRAFLPFAKPLAVYAVIVLDLLICGAWGIAQRQPRKMLVSLCVVWALPVLMILGAGRVEHFRVLGRHFTPLLPVVIIILWAGLSARWARPHWVAKAIAILFVVLAVASCASIRLAARHKKDDYRGAAAYAKAALQVNHAVWWNAGREGAEYYQVPIADQAGQAAQAIYIMNPSPEMLTKLPPPELVITSKPDVYDGGGTVAEYLRQHGYHQIAMLRAFVIWQPQAALAESGVSRNSLKLENLIE